MDTRSKSNSIKRAIGVIIGFLLICSMSISLVVFYSPAYSNSHAAITEYENKSMSSIKSSFIKALYRSNYALCMDLLQNYDSSSLEPSDLFLSGLKVSQESGGNYNKEEFCNRFDSMMDQWYQSFFAETISQYPLNYYITNNFNGSVKTNSVKSLSNLAMNSSKAKKLKASYPFYIILESGIGGKFTVKASKGLKEEQIDKFLSLQLNNDTMRKTMDSADWYQYKDKIQIPPGITIIYASKDVDFYINSQVHNKLNFDKEWLFIIGGFGYACVAILICLVLFALILPTKKSWGVGKGFSTYIPFEISAGAIALTIIFYYSLVSFALKSISAGFIFDTDFNIFPGNIQIVVIHCMNVLLWMIVMFIWYVGILSIRQIFTIGPARYVKEKTLIGRFVIWSSQKLKIAYLSLRQIDLSTNTNLTIIKVLAINFIILAMISCAWYWGIILLILHTIILFVLISKYVDDIKKKYKTLLDSTSAIADGNLDITIEEDLGVFEPLVTELTKVQQGFIKAVEEETKSERMKTELITNVSHDLKTPLTAIITYIGLLKQDNPSEDERNAYINTLDIKSQRLKRLIEDLFEISKASSNNITLDIAEVDLVDLIKQVIIELDDKVKQNDIEFRLNLPEQKVILELDSEKTFRIFENLIINITKYAMPHTRAYIDMSLKEDTVIIAIKNMSVSEMNFSAEEIVERFVRGDLSRNTEGSGLGLAITKSFVELQGGKFSISTDGDLFKVILEWKRDCNKNLKREDLEKVYKPEDTLKEESLLQDFPVST